MDFIEYVKFPARLKKVTLWTRRKFGIELEVTNSVKQTLLRRIIKSNSNFYVKMEDGWSQSECNDFWHIKTDATCGTLGYGLDKGWEIASPVGHTLWEARHFGNIAEILKKAGVQVNNRCGFHIHAEAKDLTSMQVAVIIAWWIKYEKLIVSAINPDRDYSYCRLYKNIYPVDKNKKVISQLMWCIISPKNRSAHNNPWRMRSINLVNFNKSKYNKRCTLEFRMPDCVLDSDSVYFWILFFLYFIEVFKNREMPDNFRSFSLPTALKEMKLLHTDKTFFLLDDQLFFLKHFLLERIYFNTMIIGDEKVNLDAKKILNNMWQPLKTYA